MTLKITLANLHLATAQQVFDQVVGHLRAQGQRSTTIGGSGKVICVYRSPEGLQCAAGCLIADEEYREEFEGETWVTLGLRHDSFTQEHLDLIEELQLIHDYTPVEEWEQEFQIISGIFKLVYIQKCKEV